MLQDLNARNAQEVTNHLPEQVRVMSGQSDAWYLSHRRTLLVWLSGAAALAALAALLFWQRAVLQTWFADARAPLTQAAPAHVPGAPVPQQVDAALTPQAPLTPAATASGSALAGAAPLPVNGQEVPPLAEALPPLPPSLAVATTQASGRRATAGTQPTASLQLRVAESLSMLTRLTSQKPVAAVPAKNAPQAVQRQVDGAAAAGHAAEPDGVAGANTADTPTRQSETPTVARGTLSASTSAAGVVPGMSGVSGVSGGRASVTGRVERIERGERVDEGLQRALTAYHQGRVDEAIHKLQEILSAQPRQLEARQALLSMQLEQRHHVEAMQLLTEGLALLPARSDWAMALARLQVDAGNVQGALATLQNHQPQAQGNADYLGFMGVLQQHLKLHHEAVLSYQAALRLKPREGRWWYALGLSLEADQQAEAAREAFAKARSAGGLTSAMNEAVARRLQAP